MKIGISQEFFTTYNEGFKLYQQGEWQDAVMKL